MPAETFSHFRILDKLGSGGMGVVYRAEDTTLRRTVALKFLPGDRAKEPSALERFKQEARTASSLNHPHICTIYEIGEDSGEVYIAMEYIKGQALRERVGQEGLPVDTVIRLGRQVASALDHAHEHGVIHRDLKLANIMATPQGDAKVLDFGLARRIEELDLTRTSLVDVPLENTAGLAGTFPYMAPELLAGKGASPQSDLWALGIVLYELATGCRPFSGETFFQVSTAILNQPPPPLPQRVPPGLRAVIFRCLEKEPARRYQRASEALAALEAIGSGAGDISGTSSPVAPQALATPATNKRARWLRRLTPVWTLAIVLAVIFWVMRLSRIHERALGPPGSQHIQSIAVLPLADLSSNPQEAYFADGVTEELINALSRISALRVASRTSTMRYKDTSKTVPEIARELKVDAVVDGSVQHSDGGVKIRVSLVDARIDRTLWGHSYEGELRDILGLQSQAVQAIAAEIQVQLTPQESTSLSKSRTVNPQAYDTYLRARYLWNKRKPEDLQKALDEFRKAIDLDPTSALAWGGLADGYSLLAYYDTRSPREAMPLAKAVVLKALQLDDSLAESHASLANVEWEYDWDSGAAEKEFERALALNPNYATAHQWHGLYLAEVGRFDEAISEMQRAQELDPLSLVIQVNVGRCYYYARRYDKALELLQQLEHREPDFWIVHAILGQTYLAMSRRADAIRELERARALSPDSLRNLGVLGDAYGRAGRRAEALKLLNELSRFSFTGYVPPVYSAMIYMGLGDKPQALSYLEKAFADRSDWIMQLKIEPEFDPLRADPHFQELLHRARQGQK